MMGFENSQVFNDMLQIILYHCQKKSIFQLIILKMFKKIIKKNLVKDNSILSYIDIKAHNNLQGSTNYQNNQNSNTNNIQMMNNSISQPLNQPRKDRKIYKDITEQFIDFIQQQIDPLRLQQFQNPFQGPEQHTFIGTKTLYYLVRYLLTIYQRFIKAKQLSDSINNRNMRKQIQSQQQISLYQQFLSILIFKGKDKQFEQYLRKIMNQQTFIYFTLDKFILNLIKMINNISSDSLTYKILKDQIKDYEMGIKKWSQYQYKSITEQLTRMYNEPQSLFRFTYSDNNIMYISMWQNGHMFNNIQKSSSINNNQIKQKQKDKQKQNQKEKQKQKIIRKEYVHKLYQQSIDYCTESSRSVKTKYYNYKIMNYNHNQSRDISNQNKKSSNNNNQKFKTNNKQQPDQNIEVYKRQQSQYMNLHQGIILMKGQDILLRYKRASPTQNKEDIQCVKQLDRLKKFIKKV